MSCPTPLNSDFIYQLLPEAVREEYDPGKAMEAYCKSIADMYNIFRCYNYSIRDMQSARECPADLLKFLAHTVGITNLDDNLLEKQKRQHIADAIAWYKAKGTTQSFEIALRALGFEPQIIELWCDYPRENFKAAPDIPLEIGGVMNPAYDPLNTTDGLVKYKTSNIDLSLVVIQAQPAAFINTVLATIEEVRPVHITIRYINTIFNIQDQFTEHDEVNATIDVRIQELFDMPYPTCCLYFGRYDVAEYYYDGLIAFDQITTFFDTMPGSAHHVAYYNNGTLLVYDGSVNYDGSSDIYSHSYLFNGNTYGGQYRFDCCGFPFEPENFNFIIDFTGFSDVFELASCSAFYDGGPPSDPYFFNGDMLFNGGCKIIDPMEVEVTFGNLLDSMPPITDDTTTTLGVEMVEPWRAASCIIFDGTYYYGGFASQTFYDGTFSFNGTYYYNGIGEPFPETTCDGDTFFNSSYFFDGTITYSGHYVGPCMLKYNQICDGPVDNDILTMVLQYVGGGALYDSGLLYDSGQQYDVGGGTVIIVV